MKIEAHEGEIETELVVRIWERCVPVWVGSKWEMQTLKPRTTTEVLPASIVTFSSFADPPLSGTILMS